MYAQLYSMVVPMRLLSFSEICSEIHATYVLDTVHSITYKLLQKSYYLLLRCYLIIIISISIISISIMPPTSIGRGIMRRWAVSVCPSVRLYVACLDLTERKGIGSSKLAGLKPITRVTCEHI